MSMSRIVKGAAKVGPVLRVLRRAMYSPRGHRGSELKKNLKYFLGMWSYSVPLQHDTETFLPEVGTFLFFSVGVS